jgi:general secretion pathway protein N
MNMRGVKFSTIILAAACAVLLLLALVMEAGFGRGYSWLAPDDSAALAASNIDREPFKLPPEDVYAPTNARPLFNEDRKPTPDVPDEKVEATPPSVPLNISLTGIVLTPQLHMALIQDKSKNTTISLREGMPMPGDQGGWTLTEIKKRSAIFKEMSGDEVEVELSTAVASQKPSNQPGKPGNRQAAAGAAGAKSPPPPQAAAGNAGNPQAAEQLQRRIEERRKQMREEAERIKQQQGNPPSH